MTKRQKEILDFVIFFYETNGYYPTLKDIADAFSLSAVSTIHEHLNNLVKGGYLVKEKRGRYIPKKDEGMRAKIPFYGYIAAGNPISAITDGFEYVEMDFLNDCDGCYALKVRGNSMIDEHILDGDIIIVEHRETALNGETAVVLIDDSEATLKKFYMEGDVIKLVPANREFEPMYFEPDRVKVQGIVRAIIRKKI